MRITVYVIVLILLISCTASKSTPMPNNDVYILQLKPEILLNKEIQKFVNVQHIQAGWIASCVGSANRWTSGCKFKVVYHSRDCYSMYKQVSS